jgi:hypothetical protein
MFLVKHQYSLLEVESVSRTPGRKSLEEAARLRFAWPVWRDHRAWLDRRSCLPRRRTRRLERSGLTAPHCGRPSATAGPRVGGARLGHEMANHVAGWVNVLVRWGVFWRWAQS